ncbi:MAG TPA: phosphoribosyltransferase family protein [Clostridia bacterium]|nr:phosphoribosyltransferase family protein [Clostridia bacterium]
MFRNRNEAGEKLAAKLKAELSPQEKKNALVLAIPRGGIIIGDQIRQKLKLSLDCLISKKIPAPGNQELAIGAVGEGGVVVWEEGLVNRLGISLDYKKEIVKEKVAELEKKDKDFRQGKEIPQMEGKSVILADDGVATGATIKVAIKVIRSYRPQEIIVAVPVIALDSLPAIKEVADKVVYLEAPEMFFSVNQFYEDFQQISDEEAREILKT